MSKVLNGLAIGGGVVTILGVGFLAGSLFFGNQEEPVEEPKVEVVEETKETETQETEEEVEPEVVVVEEEEPVDPVLQIALDTPAAAPTGFNHNPFLMDNPHTLTNGTAKCIGWLQVTDNASGAVYVEYTCNVCWHKWTGTDAIYKVENGVETTAKGNWEIYGETCEHQKALQNNGYIK